MVIIVINEDGMMNENVGFYVGFKIEEVRKKIVEDFEKMGFFYKKEKIRYRVFCYIERSFCMVFIEFLLKK